MKKKRTDQMVAPGRSDKVVGNVMNVRLYPEPATYVNSNCSGEKNWFKHEGIRNQGNV
jgi:hypothetical protein